MNTFIRFVSLLVALFSITQSCVLAQVGIGTATPNAKSILELSATDKGFLPPRLDRATLTLNNTTDVGMIVYDTNDDKPYFWNGTAWVEMTAGSVVSPWTQSGGNIYPNSLTDNVGIGKNNPGAALDVAGSVVVDGNAQGNGSNFTSRGLLFGGSGSGEGVASNQVGGVNYQGLDFYTAYNKRMVIDNNGNVGVGTVGPSTRFHVKQYDGLNNGTVTVATFTHSPSGTASAGIGTQLGFETQNGIGNAVYTGYISSELTDVTDGAENADMVFKLKQTGVTTETVRFTADGSVGVGVAQPSAKMHVVALDANSNNVTPLLYLTHSIAGTSLNGVGAGAVFEIENDNNTYVNAASVAGILSDVTNGSEKGALTFSTYDSGALAEQMRLANNGYLGVGTATPAHRLQVNNGNIYISNTNDVAGKLIFAENSSNGVNTTTFRAQKQSVDINYVLPGAQGANGTVLTNDGSGGLMWLPAAGEATTAANGLTLSGTDVKLGGTLTEYTIIDGNSLNLTLGTADNNDVFSIESPNYKTNYASDAIKAQLSTPFRILGGDGAANVDAPQMTIMSGVGSGTGKGGDLKLLAGFAENADGGAAYLQGGNSGTTVGGNVYVLPGEGSAADGNVLIAYDPNTSSQRGTVGIGMGDLTTAMVDIKSNQNVGLRLQTHMTGAGETAQLMFNELDANGSSAVGFKAPDDVTGTTVWTLPDGNGTGALTNDGSGNLSWSAGATYTASNGLTMSGNDAQLGGQLSGDTDIDLNTNDLTLSNGNVGIGAASPNAKLDVYQTASSGNPTMYIHRNVITNTSPLLHLESENAGDGAVGFKLSQKSYGDFVQIIDNQPTPNTPIFYIKPSGNVGIGTNAPTQLLDVNGNAIVRGELDMNTANKIVNLSDPTVAQDAATKAYVDAAASGTNFIQNQTAADQTADFQIGGSGQIGTTLGLGTATATEKLNIAGNILFTNGASRSIQVEAPAAGGGNSFFLNGANGSASGGFGGTVFINGGDATGAAANTGGNVQISAGDASTLNASTGGDAFLSGGNGGGSAVGGNGGSANLVGGNAGGTGNRNGGDVNIYGGTKTGTGTVGNVILAVGTAGNVGIGDATPLALLTVGNGDLFRVINTGHARSINGTVGAPTYSFTGSPTTGIYAPANGQIAFSAAGTQKMFIGAGGVGIGTASPSANLHIAPSIVGSGTAVVSQSISPTYTGTQSGNTIQLSISPATSTATATNVGLIVDLGNLTGGTNIAALFQNGNVGIGDGSPASPLTVGAGDAFQVGSDGDIDQIKGLAYSWPTSQATGVLMNDGSGGLTWTSPTGVFIQNQQASDQTANFRITGDGRLGGGLSIGSNAAPSFDIMFGGGANRTIQVDRAPIAGNGADLRVQAGASSTLSVNAEGGALKLSSGVSRGLSSNGSAIEFYTSNGGAAGDVATTLKMTLSGAGNLGIGTPTPGYALDVVGVANASAGYRVNNTVAAAGSYLRGNGTNFVAGSIQAADLPSLATQYIQNQIAANQTADFRLTGAGRIGTSLIIGNAASAPTAVLQTEKTYTAISGTNQLGLFKGTATPSGASSATITSLTGISEYSTGGNMNTGVLIGTVGESVNSSNSTVGSGIGLQGLAENYVGNMNLAQGVSAVALNSGGTTMTTAEGVNSVVQTTSGNISNAVGLKTELKNTGTGVVTAGSGVYIKNPVNSGGGSIVSYTGIAIEQLTSGVANTAISYNHATLPFTVAGNGRVGIGSASPAQMLDVNGASILRGQLDMNTANKIVNLATPTNPGDATNKSYVDGLASGTNFIQNQNAANQTGNFRISGNGTVNGSIGIGVTAPTARLDVRGNSVFLSENVSSPLALSFGRTAADADLGVAGNFTDFSNFANVGDFVLRTNTDDLILTARNATGSIIFGSGATDTEKMRMANNGNFGIGVSPSQKLDVNGNILISNTGTAGELRFAEPSGGGTEYTAFKAGSQTANITYTLPTLNSNGFLTNTGSSLSWTAGNVESTTASNGLTKTGFDVQLGGALTGATTITQGANAFNIANSGTANTTINLSSTGDFDVQDNGTSAFFVRDDGFVGIGVNAPATKFDLRDGNMLLSSNTVTPNELRLEEGTNTTGDNYTAFRAGDQAANITYTLPTTSTNGVLTNTAGTLSWTTPTTGTVTGTGTQDFVTKWNPAGTGILNSTIRDNGTVGINNAPNAAQQLNVNSSLATAFYATTSNTALNSSAIKGETTGNGQAYGVWGVTNANFNLAAGVRADAVGGSSNSSGLYATNTSSATFANAVYAENTGGGFGVDILANHTGIGNAMRVTAQGTKTNFYTGAQISNAATSSTDNINKLGLGITSTGVWNGLNAVNTGLTVQVSGGTVNYAATFTGGNVGIGTTTPGASLDVQNGNFLLSNTGTAGELRFAEPSGGGTEYTAFKAGSQAANITYTLPTAAPTVNGQALTSTTAGAMSWTTLPTAESTTASNGLTKTGFDVALGGSLTGATTITQASNAFNIANNGTANTTINLSSTGDFDIQDNGTSVVFVRDDGLIGIGTNTPSEKFEVQGNIIQGSAYKAGFLGSVGIGHNFPSQKLDVRDGNMYLSNSGTAGQLRFQEPNASGLNFTAFQAQAQAADITYTLPVNNVAGVLTNNGTGTLSWVAAATGDITAVGSMLTGDAFASPAASGQWLGLGAAAGRIEFQDLATDEVNILNANVGVGTAAPNYPLDVVGVINAGTGYRVNNAAATAGTFLRGDGTNFVAGSIQSSDLPSLASQYIQNQIASDQTASFRVSGTGMIQNNLGIGTGGVAPTKSLVVEKSGSTAEVDVHTYGGVTSNDAHTALILARARGTQAVPTAIQSNDILGSIIFRGHYGGAGNWQSNGAAEIRAEAAETFASATNGGSRLAFSTVANGTATQVKRMTIDQNGNVGIGTTTPGNLFVVSQDLNTSDYDTQGQLAIRGVSNPNKVLMLGFNTTANFAYITSSIDGVSPQILSLNPGGGNVGIGTVSPSQSLEVSNGIIFISNNNNNAGELRFQEPSSSGVNYTRIEAQAQAADILYTLPAAQGAANTFMRNDGSGGLSWVGLTSESTTASNGLTLVGNDVRLGGTVTAATTISNASTSNLVFDLTSTGDFEVRDAGATAFYIRDDGNVGIGTIAPASQLEIRKSAGGAVGPVLTLTNPGGGGAQTAIDMNGYDPAGNPATARILSTDDGNFSSHLTFLTKTPGASANALTERLRVHSNGNVGIGVSLPQEKLDVNGNAIIRNALSVGTTVLGTSGILMGADNTYIVKMDRHTSGGIGQVLQIEAGGCAAGLNNGAGGILELCGGKSTGNNSGASAITFKTYDAGASGTTDNTSSEKMRLTSTGRLGLGASFPDHKLVVDAASGTDPFIVRSNGSGYLRMVSGGKVGIGSFFTPVNALDIDGGVVMGNTYKGTATAPSSGLLVEGFVGVGTTNPQSPLHVAFEGGTAHGNINRYFNNATPPAVNLAGSAVAIRADGDIWSNGGSIVASSDERIKTEIETSDAASDLAKINQITVRDYLFKDTLAKGKDYQKGFIAQELEKVDPLAVVKQTAVVPDVYQLAQNIALDTLNKTLAFDLTASFDLKQGDKLKVILETGEQLLTVQSAKNNRVILENCPTKTANQVFVFGREVADFRTVDYNRVFTTGISAIQELSKKVETLETTNSTLTDENARLKAEATDAKSRLTDLETRMARIEQLLQQSAAANSR